MAWSWRTSSKWSESIGSAERLLVEIEDSNPEEFVHVPIAGLTPLVRGGETDLSTSMTRPQLEALSSVTLPPR